MADEHYADVADRVPLFAYGRRLAATEHLGLGPKQLIALCLKARGDYGGQLRVAELQKLLGVTDEECAARPEPPPECETFETSATSEPESADPAADEQEERPPRVKAPYMMSEDDDALPVSDPGFPLSDFELLTSEVLVTAAELARTAAAVRQGRRQPGRLVADLLQLRATRAGWRFINGCEEARALLEKSAAQGLAFLQEHTPPGEALQMPLYADFGAPRPADFYPISWVVVLVRDPLNEDEVSVVEPQVWRLLGVVEALHQRLGRWLDLRAAGAVADCTLLYQLDQVLQDAHRQVMTVLSSFRKGAVSGAELEREEQRTEALLDVPLAELPMDPNLVILGSDRMVPYYAKLGRDRRGRHLALSLFTAQLVLALGGRGWGKSHLGRLIAECLHLYIPGINNAPPGLRSASFEVDYHLGPGRRQMLRGMFPNCDEDFRTFSRSRSARISLTSSVGRPERSARYW